MRPNLCNLQLTARLEVLVCFSKQGIPIAHAGAGKTAHVDKVVGACGPGIRSVGDLKRHVGGHVFGEQGAAEIDAEDVDLGIPLGHVAGPDAAAGAHV
ncbi:hypothetical protein HG531_002697 [Fusarium graminearum]|nr:hypothetical protein HG531_002697 [Fusarium graminearum]